MLKDKEGMNNPYLLANPLTWLFDNIEDDLAWRDNQGPVLDILNYYHYLSHDGVRLHSQLKAFSEQLEEKYTVCNICNISVWTTKLPNCKTTTYNGMVDIDASLTMRTV